MCEANNSINGHIRSAERTIVVKVVNVAAPDTPSAPQIELERGLEQLEENTPFRVTCRGDVGYPVGDLQLVSNCHLIKDFESIPEGCGDQVLSCSASPAQLPRPAAGTQQRPGHFPERTRPPTVWRSGAAQCTTTGRGGISLPTRQLFVLAAVCFNFRLALSTIL